MKTAHVVAALSLVLATSGALLGIGIGVGLTLLAAALYPDFPMRPDPVWIAVVLALSLAAGVGFGLMPARRAAKVAAADALQGRIV